MSQNAFENTCSMNGQLDPSHNPLVCTPPVALHVHHFDFLLAYAGVFPLSLVFLFLGNLKISMSNEINNFFGSNPCLAYEV